MFIKEALAAPGGVDDADLAIAAAEATEVAQGGGFDPASLMPLILIGLIFYFMLIRPQQKKMKEEDAMRTGLRRNDEIVTTGGIVGKIIRANEGENELTVEIADGVRVKMLRQAIAYVKGDEAPAEKAEKSEKTEEAK